MNHKLRVTLTALSLAATSAHGATYEPNTVWQRWADWTPGTAAGTSAGNADSDLGGTPVWRYGVLTGGALGSDDPWYENDAQLMVWDDEWWGSNVGGVWARGYYGPGVNNDNANPPIDRYTQWYDASSVTHSYGYASTVDWMNPVGDGALINFSGALKLEWYGHFTAEGQASPSAPLDVVIAKYDASENKFFSLYTSTVINPTAGSPLSGLSTATLPVTFTGVRFDAGDFLRVTFRADTPESDTPLWMGMRDGLYMRLVSVVPEPASSYMMLLGGLFIIMLSRCKSRLGG